MGLGKGLSVKELKALQGESKGVAGMKQQEKRELKEWARGFKLLGDPTRLGILRLLAGGPKNVMTLCKALKLRQKSVSQHLAPLRMGGLVDMTRKGRFVTYSIEKRAIKVLRSACLKLTPR